MNIVSKLLVTISFISIIFSQDEIFFKNGSKIIAKIDTSSLKANNESIRLKKRGEPNYSFLNLSTVNFIRSWNGILLYPIGVIVNTGSGRIHLPNVEHLPAEFQRLKYDSKDEAEKNGFELCNACFDNSPILSDIDLELELTKETILAIQNTNEIMYEHEKLPVLQNYVDKILANWPEKLKGYDYRIQIIRDKSPNAMAVAGGNLYFTTGLIDMTENDAELEAVVAHEIAHVERRHSLRGYKSYLKKQQIAAAAGLVLGVIAANNSNSDNVQIGTAIAALATGYALEFAQKGYERDLEQESDMFAQIYLTKINETNKPMLSSLDKLATYTGSRIGFVPTANAYSSHPDLTSRINQLKNGELFTYENPVEFSFIVVKKKKKKNNLKDGFVDLDVNYLYSAPSSEDKFKKEIIIAGTINNNDPTYSFRIDELKLNFVGTLGVTNLKGLVDIVVPRAGSIDFVGRVRAKPDQAKIILEQLKNKNILPFSSMVSAVIVKPGEEMQTVNSLTRIKTAIAVR